MKVHPADTINNPQVGMISKRDTQGFPLFPTLFITDVTNDPGNTSGDAQHGGTPIPPDTIYGSWKAAGGKNPTQNGWNLPTGADPFPAQPIQLTTTTNRKIENQYGSEIIWAIDNLHLTAGHSYRAQFVVHDGDLNKDGGDIGIGCMTIHY